MELWSYFPFCKLFPLFVKTLETKFFNYSYNEPKEQCAFKKEFTRNKSEEVVASTVEVSATEISSILTTQIKIK